MPTIWGQQSSASGTTRITSFRWRAFIGSGETCVRAPAGQVCRKRQGRGRFPQVLRGTRYSSRVRYLAIKPCTAAAEYSSRSCETTGLTSDASRKGTPPFGFRVPQKNVSVHAELVQASRSFDSIAPGHFAKDLLGSAPRLKLSLSLSLSCTRDAPSNDNIEEMQPKCFRLALRREAGGLMTKGG
jgi:hypothetical protein